MTTTTSLTLAALTVSLAAGLLLAHLRPAPRTVWSERKDLIMQGLVCPGLAFLAVILATTTGLAVGAAAFGGWTLLVSWWVWRVRAPRSFGEGHEPGGGGDGGSDLPHDPHGSSDGGLVIDWDAFETAFWAHVASLERDLVGA